MNGWAIECRINAEDPFNNFLPSIGRITRLSRHTGPGVRIDTGVYTGCEITPYYDSLLTKIIVWGETRAEAVLRMRRALEEYRVIGVKTNVPFFQALIDSHRFMAGQFDTTFVEQRFSMSENIPPHLPYVAAMVATLVAHQRSLQAMEISRPANCTSRWKWGRRG
jgi:acetyl-CoA carboxylase, biotin carboxylase subunit